MVYVSMAKIITGSNANSRHIVWEARTLTPEVSHFLSSFIVKIYLGETSQLLQDLTLASREIAPLISGWRVLNGHSFSDYWYISYNLDRAGPVRDPYKNF